MSQPNIVKKVTNDKFIKTEKGKTSNPNLADLRKCFSTIVDRKSLNVRLDDLKNILYNDLQINNTIEETLILVLANSLTYYMRIWPGWARSTEYFKGELQFKEWFERFRQYLIYKMNFIIKNEERFLGTCGINKQNLPDVVRNKFVKLASKSTQCKRKIPDEKPESPYTLCISGPPNVLNNIVFTQTDNNVVIKQHGEKDWMELQPKELLNWPHVSVEVQLPDISFSRSALHDFQRYITLASDATVYPEVDHIAYIKQTTTKLTSDVYTHNFISTYSKQLFETLRNIPEVNETRVQELEAIFAEFLDDVRDANVCDGTMSTYRSVCYHIGGSRYIRNKKLVGNTVRSSLKKSGDQNTIVFCELLVPKIEFSLNSIKAVQDIEADDVSFVSLNELNLLLTESTSSKKLEELKFLVNNTCMVYHCTLCVQNFSGPYASVNLKKHIETEHKCEQAVLCYKCRSQFDVNFLSGCRWYHDCI